jgi:hypothetical protein
MPNDTERGDTQHGKISYINFADMRLRAGTWMQMRSLFDKAPDCDVEFAAALHGKSIFVTLPASVTGKGGMQAGHRYLVRGFDGRSDFAFSSQVIQVQERPFYLAHLEYPDSVEVRVVREAKRYEVAIPVVVMPEGGGRPISGTIRNLSATGAMIELDAIPGRVNGKASITFATLFNGREASLNIPATIRHVHDEDGPIRSGFEFGNISQSDKLVLYYLLLAFSSKE